MFSTRTNDGEGYLIFGGVSTSPTPARVLIVEDEMIIAAKISLHLEQLGYAVEGILTRGEEAVLHCRNAPPDVLLLDVNLKGDLDGVDTARLLRKEGLDVPTIYLTANSDAATFDRAKLTGPSAFLSKPYRKTELARAVELALIGRSPAPTTAGAGAENSYLLSDRIFVRHNDRMVRLALSDIQYIEAERAYCRIQTAGTEYLLSLAMGRLEEQVKHGDLVRVHRSYLVNLRHVEAIADNHLVVAGRAIPLSRSHRAEFLQKVNLIR